ncbi:MAG TPA: putative 2OG-Fe(II) oxygenase [Sphingopyxis sp.]|nr:putative 2OG-Fe(II) oxygenase [Sphingopyxis sp.]HMP45634.1 putative 2OG-Fe(II) oxygenase [Sphingopyxis sp.]HMQ19762.1 putative 2OG-Fe(II) oxygenase [Sphingopyxis sp.]
MASTDQGGQTSALDVIVDRALSARDAGRPEEGAAAIKTALAGHPRDARLWQVLGLLHRAMQESDAAAAALGKAAELAPGDARIAHAHARVTMEGGLPSLPLFERARALAPLDGDLLISRAAAQMAEGEGRSAIAELDALLETSPNWLQGQEALANMRWMLGEREIFTQGYERALAADPANIALWAALAARLMHADLYRAIDDMLARARAAAGPHLAFDANEAICASELGDHDRADRLFDRLAAIPDPAFAVRHVRHLLRTGRIEAAARRAEPLTRGPEAAHAWPYLAIAWRLLGDERWRWLEGDERLVGVYDIMDPDEIAPLRERLRSLHNTLSYPIGQSVRGGTQTDGPLFARVDPEIRALRARIVEAVEAHVARFAPGDPTHPVLRHGGRKAAVRFAGSWSVRLAGAGFHTQHIHQQGWISSAFYVAVPDAAEMGAAPAGWLSLGQPPPELGIDLPPLRTVEPRPGRLALFPSIMWHGTLPFAGGERMTVAFDVAPPAG